MSNLNLAALEQKIEHFLLSRIPSIQAIYLFGSVSTQQSGPESDIDIAVLFLEKIDPATLWFMAQDLARELDQDVDLVDLRKASTIFQHQIVYYGHRFFCSDRYKVDLFETYVLSEYTNFIEARSPLVRDFLERGSL